MALLGLFKKEKKYFGEEEVPQIKSLEQFKIEREKSGIVEFKEENNLDKAKSIMHKIFARKVTN